MTFRKSLKYSLVVVALVFCLSVSRVSAQQQRGPSTPEERVRAVQIAKALRSDPLSDSNTKDREWLVRWLVEVPDISVKLCGGILGDLGNSNKSPYPGALLATMLASEGAYVIENPS
jgi:hypothetical protein